MLRDYQSEIIDDFDRRVPRGRASGPLGAVLELLVEEGTSL